MTWPLDRAKLDRVRSLMKEQGFTALVVRAPDNVLYLSNYWGMKGYDAIVFPQIGGPTLIALEPQQADAERNSWTNDIRLFKGYHENDPRPPQYRAFDIAVQVLKEKSLTDKVGLELNMGTQSADRMVGEPTTFTQTYFDLFRKNVGELADATPLLNEARAIKTPQEIERMRLANELAALAMDYTRDHMRAGMKESEVGGMYESFVQSKWPAPSRWCGRGPAFVPSPQPVIVRCRKTSPRFLKSGSAWMATGPTLQRTLAPAN